MRRALSALALALCLCAVAAAQDAPGLEPSELVDDALAKMARLRNKQGLEFFRNKEYPEAMRAFREAYELNPKDAEVANNLAYLLDLLGNRQEAEEFYRQTIENDPARYIAYLNLADLLGRKGESPERLIEAADLLARARVMRGNAREIVLRQARVAAARGRFEDAKSFYGELFKLEEPTDKLLLEMGDLLRDRGHDEEAVQWYRRVEAGGDWGQEAAKKIWEVEVEKQARRFGWTSTGDAIPSQARVLATRGRIMFQGGNPEGAEKLLNEAIGMAPQFAEARADLGDVLRAADRSDEAERSYLQAVAMENSNAEFHAKLAEFYADREGAKNAAMAIVYFSRALELRPDWAELYWKRAHARQAVGDIPSAVEDVRRYVESTVSDEKRLDAVTFKARLEQMLPPGTFIEYGDDDDKGPIGDAVREIRGYLARGELDKAMAAFAALPDDKRDPEILNLTARIFYAAGRYEEAAGVLRASLEQKDDQASTHVLLALTLERAGQSAEAESQWRRARDLGDVRAAVHLAAGELASLTGGPFADMVRLRELSALKSRLEDLLRTNEPGAEPAWDLRERIKKRQRVAMGLWTGIGTALILAAAVVWRRRRGGAGLRRLLETHPETGPEIQSILSAIRHEVLKHNTLVLTGLADAIERGDPSEGGGEKARYVKRSLDTAKAKLDDYDERLTGIGRAHGLRMNLAERDPAFAALRAGFDAVAACAPDLENVDRLSARNRARLLGRLRTASHHLNVEGYEAVRELLDQLRVLEVDEAMLRDVFERTLREPAFAGLRIDGLVFRDEIGLPCGVPVPRRALEDVLTNLFRNALQSSPPDGRTEIGLTVRSERDPITAIERVVFFVFDRSDKPVTEEMIRARRVEDGLGLTSELVGRFEGTIEIVPGEGAWTKAVAVKFPRAGDERGGEES
ncbi:MAG: tetratricopeptide repeat protein [Deltaproteobacteria bacterium]|nr:tetratricopeptide repeat protein [Deltaproteobacteria bacterium]